MKTRESTSDILRDRSLWTVPKIASRRIAESADKIFVSEIGGRTETYVEFWRHARRLARSFDEIGVRNGESVAVFAFNGIAALHVWMATSILGAVDVSINTAYRGEPLKHAIETSRATFVVVDVALESTLDELDLTALGVRDLMVIAAHNDNLLAETAPGLKRCSYNSAIERGPMITETRMADIAPRPQDTASIIFTSGTTGPAKAVMMPHAQVCLLALETIEATALSAVDVFYTVHPHFHIAGKFMGVLAIFAAGGSLIMERKFCAETWLARIQETGATVSIAHGPMIEMIHAAAATADDNNHRMTRLMCCPLPRGIAQSFTERFSVAPIEMWGMSEVGCPIWTPPDRPFIPGSCGRVLTEWYEVDVVDPDTDEPVSANVPGELVVRPKYPWTIMKGYMGRPEDTARTWRNLWFHTGDSAYRNQQGDYFFVDRLGDRIRRRAENISSFDIEIAVGRYADVAECAAIGIPSEFENDDNIMVYVVPRSGAVLDLVELLKFLKNRLPHFMVPRYVEVVDELPRTPTNKVRKTELRSLGVRATTWDRKAAGVSLRKL